MPTSFTQTSVSPSDSDFLSIVLFSSIGFFVNLLALAVCRACGSELTGGKDFQCLYSRTEKL